MVRNASYSVLIISPGIIEQTLSSAERACQDWLKIKQVPQLSLTPTHCWLQLFYVISCGHNWRTLHGARSLGMGQAWHVTNMPLSGVIMPNITVGQTVQMYLQT